MKLSKKSTGRRVRSPAWTLCVIPSTKASSSKRPPSKRPSNSQMTTPRSTSYSTSRMQVKRLHLLKMRAACSWAPFRQKGMMRTPAYSMHICTHRGLAVVVTTHRALTIRCRPTVTPDNLAVSTRCRSKNTLLRKRSQSWALRSLGLSSSR